jgi:hypothetical protein
MMTLNAVVSIFAELFAEGEVVLYLGVLINTRCSYFFKLRAICAA